MDKMENKYCNTLNLRMGIKRGDNIVVDIHNVKNFSPNSTSGKANVQKLIRETFLQIHDLVILVDTGDFFEIVNIVSDILRSMIIIPKDLKCTIISQDYEVHTYYNIINSEPEWVVTNTSATQEESQ